MNDFLGENDIIASVPSGYKACLERMDEVGQEGFELLDKKLRNRFVEGVAKANGSELMNGFRFIHFWNEANEGVIEIFQDRLGSEDIFYKGNDRQVDNVPVSLEENGERIKDLISGVALVQFPTESLRHHILLWCLRQRVERWKKFVLRSPRRVHSMQDFKAQNSSSGRRICWYSTWSSVSRFLRRSTQFENITTKLNATDGWL